MKNYINISGFNLYQPNRGNAALNYGAMYFLLEKGYVNDDTELVAFRYYRNIFKALLKPSRITKVVYAGRNWRYTCYPVSAVERWILHKFKVLLPWTRYGKIMRQTKLAVADYGGDGFSDIYGQKIYESRFNQTENTLQASIPLIVLPQTIGPFQKEKNYKHAVGVLKKAQEVYVRDDKFVDELNKNNIPFVRTKDLSSFMLPEKIDIDIDENPVGINVSGLAYSNKFVNLEGQFDAYPFLIHELINYFRNKGHTVYLIPHSYDYNCPEKNNDDMVACREVYCSLKDKSNVVVVDKNLTAPQVKYVISQMKFFVGTRMHANFAAIYTGVPLFGLAYSYKFAGAFYANGLDGEKQTYLINNMPLNKIQDALNKIDVFYNEILSKKKDLW